MAIPLKFNFEPYLTQNIHQIFLRAFAGGSPVFLARLMGGSPALT